MDYITRILKRFSSLEPIEKRIAVFNYVRDIPYKITGKQDPYLLYKNRQGECAAKAKLLSLLLRELGYSTRPLLVKYKLRKVPSEVKYIPSQIDYHHALQVKLGQKWVTVDATYDSRLSGKKFKVNQWDCIHSTPLAEKPLAIKMGRTQNRKFDHEFKQFIRKLIEANKAYPTQLKAYTKKFNQMISKSRKN